MPSVSCLMKVSPSHLVGSASFISLAGVMAPSTELNADFFSELQAHDQGCGPISNYSVERALQNMRDHLISKVCYYCSLLPFYLIAFS